MGNPAKSTSDGDLTLNISLTQSLAKSLRD
jgi:hypothetical protein